MSFTDKEAFNFNYGYTNFTTGNKKDAEKYLQRVTTSKTYGSQAKYYIGFMAYEGDDYNTANAYFEQVSDNENTRKSFPITKPTSILNLVSLKKPSNWRSSNYQRGIQRKFLNSQK